MEKVKEITPNLEDVVGRNDIFRLNVSQFLILPEYQRKVNCFDTCNEARSNDVPGTWLPNDATGLQDCHER